MLPQIEISFDVVALIALFITGAVFFHRKVVLPAIRNIRSILQEIDRIPESRKKIDVIFSEVRPNGGTSIKDAIARLEKQITLIEQKQNVYLLESSQGIYETDSEGNCISTNRTYLKIVKRSEKEVLGKGWYNCIAHHDRERVTDAWNDAVGNKIEFSLSYDMITSGGTIIPVYGVAYPMQDPQTKQIIGWLGTIVPTIN